MCPTGPLLGKQPALTASSSSRQLLAKLRIGENAILRNSAKSQVVLIVFDAPVEQNLGFQLATLIRDAVLFHKFGTCSKRRLGRVCGELTDGRGILRTSRSSVCDSATITPR